MDNEVFIKILLTTLEQVNRRYAFIYLLIAVLLPVILKRPSHAEKPSRFSKNNCMFLLVCLFILTSIMLVRDNISFRHDIANKQFVEIQGYYSYDSTTGGKVGWFSNGRVNIGTDEDKFILELPAEWSKEEFPEGHYSGTIWFAKESEIILRFVQNNTVD